MRGLIWCCSTKRNMFYWKETILRAFHFISKKKFCVSMKNNEATKLVLKRKWRPIYLQTFSKINDSYAGTLKFMQLCNYSRISHIMGSNEKNIKPSVDVVFFFGKLTPSNWWRVNISNFFGNPYCEDKLCLYTLRIQFLTENASCCKLTIKY